MEKYLSQNEIEKVLNDIKKEEYLNDNIFHIGRSKTSIMFHSKDSGLILIRGNEHFGYEHILNRHSLFSRIPYKDNPSKMRLETLPIEWLCVLSKIFKKENLNLEKNHSPEIFDVFHGEYKHFDNKKIRYRLVTYKNTGIIHTFFVITNSKPFNPKNVLKLRKGWVGFSKNLKIGNIIYNFSYYDNNDKEIIKVFVKSSLFEEKEDWSVEVYDKSGNVVNRNNLIGIDLISRNIFDRENELNFGDISLVEKEIKKIQEQLDN